MSIDALPNSAAILTDIAEQLQNCNVIDAAPHRPFSRGLVRGILRPKLQRARTRELMTPNLTNYQSHLHRRGRPGGIDTALGKFTARGRYDKSRGVILCDGHDTRVGYALRFSASLLPSLFLSFNLRSLVAHLTIEIMGFYCRETIRSTRVSERRFPAA